MFLHIGSRLEIGTSQSYRPGLLPGGALLGGACAGFALLVVERWLMVVARSIVT